MYLYLTHFATLTGLFDPKAKLPLEEIHQVSEVNIDLNVPKA